MLETLKEVNWSELTHAYGSADDVPDLIRELASSKVKDREHAMHELYGNIWHQGTVYEATAYAVPFLIELLVSDSVADKDQILLLLAALANGRSYLDVHQHLDIFKAGNSEEMKTAEWRQELATELDWVKKTTEAVKRQTQVYFSLLAHPDWNVRDTAAYLLASLGGPEPEAAAQLKRRLNLEGQETVKASLLLALGATCQRDSVNREEFMLLLGNDSSKSARLAAAASLIRMAPDQLSPSALSLLTESIQRPEDYAALEKSCWLEGDGVVPFISRYVALLPQESSERVQELLQNILPSQKTFQALSIAGALLMMVFPEPVLPGTGFDALNARQQKALLCLAVNRHFWGVQRGKDFVEFVNASSLMRAYNLPARFDEIQVFIQRK